MSEKDFDIYERKGSLISNGLPGNAIGGDGIVSMLDISTRLRITEAELAIVKNEVSDLVAEKNALEVQCKKHENSWKFALIQLGRMVEERNDALSQVPPRTPLIRESRSPDMRLKKMKPSALKSELENSLQQLETQTRVSRQIEQERDKANDDLEFAKSQVSTLMMQHNDLLTTCAEVARQRDKAESEAKLLREELNRYDKELHSAIESELGEDGECDTDKEKALLQQIRLLREEKQQLQRSYHQSVEQYKRQITKCNMDRRQTASSADAMKALLQRRLESAQSDNTELRSELRASGEMIAQLKDQLAQVRIACHHHNGYDIEITTTTHDDMSTEQQTMMHSNAHLIPPLSQDTGITLYNSKTENSELITPGNHSNVSNYHRVSSARGPRKNPYIPTASPFPEESREESSEDEDASWI